MLHKFQKQPIIVADEHGHVRRLVTEVLRMESFNNVFVARDGEELQTKVIEFAPKVVLTTANLPKISGVEFTRAVRAGMLGINRSLAIILMTNAVTPSFVNEVRKAGVDELLICPFSAAALMARLESVFLRPRRFIESANYKGPCRRRKMLEDYGGPLRRFVDPVDDVGNKEVWEAESNRALARLCVQKLSELSVDMAPGDRARLRQLYAATQDTEQLADDIQDVQLGDSARSLSRYIIAIGANGMIDPEVVSTHLDAMQKLGVMSGAHTSERKQLVDGLSAVVDKRLGVAVDATTVNLGLAS